MTDNSDKKILYIDMDNVLVDFRSSFEFVDPAFFAEYNEKNKLDEVPGIFSLMQPMPGAVEAFETLSKVFDTYILSTSPWLNPSAWSDKLLWVKMYLGESAYKRLILTHYKNLNIGDYLVDDRTKNGADKFKGELILFGSEKFPGWEEVVEYLLG